MQYFTEFLKMHIKWSTFAKFSHLISLYIHPWMPLIWGPLPSSHSQPDIPWDSQTNSLLLYFGICIHVASALFGSCVFELEKFMYLQLHYYLVFVFGFFHQNFCFVTKIICSAHCQEETLLMQGWSSQRCRHTQVLLWSAILKSELRRAQRSQICGCVRTFQVIAIFV